MIRLGLNSGGACGGRTVITGGGAENTYTSHINTPPKESATTATNGIQTRAKTVLPTERGLTPSPFGIRSPTSCPRFVPDPGVKATPLGRISTRLRYGRYDTTSRGRNTSKRCVTLSAAGAVGSTSEPTSNSPEINGLCTPYALCCFKPFSVVALSTLRCGEAEWRGLWSQHGDQPEECPLGGRGSMQVVKTAKYKKAAQHKQSAGDAECHRRTTIGNDLLRIIQLIGRHGFAFTYFL